MVPKTNAQFRRYMYDVSMRLLSASPSRMGPVPRPTKMRLAGMRRHFPPVTWSGRAVRSRLIGHGLQ